MKKIFIGITFILFNLYHLHGKSNAPFQYDSIAKVFNIISSNWNGEVDLVGYIETFNDSLFKFSFNEISKKKYLHLLKKNDKYIINENQNKVTWGRLEIKNVSSSNSEWRLITYHPRLFLYCVYSRGIISKQFTGVEVPVKYRSISALSPVLALSLRKDESAVLFFKIESKKTDWVPPANFVSISITASKEIEQSQNTQWIIHGIFGSYMLLTILFSLLLFIVIKDKSFLYLIGCCLFNLLLYWDISGISKVLYWTDIPLFYISIYGVPIWYAGIFLFTFLFTDKLLSLKINLPKFRIFYMGFLFLFCLVEFLRSGLNNPKSLAPIANYLAIICLFLLLVAVVYLAIKGNRQAKFLTIATLLLFLGGLSTVLFYQKILPPMFEYAAQVGMALYILMISIGAVDKIRKMREEKEKLIKEQNINLEKKVEERTKELKETQLQLLESEKLAAFGTIATRVAHEIQNPLNFVNNFSEMSEELVSDIISAKNDEERKEAGEILTENLKKINHHGKRAEHIVAVLQKHIDDGTTHEFFEEEKK